MKRTIWQALGGLVLPLALLACDGTSNIQEVEFSVPVSVETVELGDVEDRIVATGTPESRMASTRSSRSKVRSTTSPDGYVVCSGAPMASSP